jgi:hypothetical protein
MCILIFSIIFVWNISHSENLLQTYTGLHVKYQLFLSYFDETWIFPTDLQTVIRYEISRQSIQWVLICSMRTDGLTDTTELKMAFRNLAKSPKNEQ